MNPRFPPPLGFPLLPVPDENGALHWPGSLDESVRDAIRCILATRPGERLMRPDFGAGLDRFLGEPDALVVRRRLHDATREALRRHEPRAEVERVDVLDIPGRPGELRVEIVYRLRRTGAVRNLGLSLRTGV